jgi:hypothetical protein
MTGNIIIPNPKKQKAEGYRGTENSQRNRGRSVVLCISGF